MFGPDILVAPVITEGAREREVYLPAGAVAGRLDRGDCSRAASRIIAEAPLERIPVCLQGRSLRSARRVISCVGGEPG